MIPTFELRRVAVREDGCFSAFLCHGRPFAVTNERTFENLRVVVGMDVVRKCRRTTYHRGGYETFEIEVPGHSRVLFHRGNKEGDSEGCVLVAESFSTIDGQTIIGDSKNGFAEFMELARSLKEFDLYVSAAP